MTLQSINPMHLARNSRVRTADLQPSLVHRHTAAELCKHEGVLALVEVSEAVTHEGSMRHSSRSLEHHVLAIKEVG